MKKFIPVLLVVILKKMMTLQNHNGITFAGKTGSKDGLGWFVGYISNGEKNYVFATNIEGNPATNGTKARQITEGMGD